MLTNAQLLALTGLTIQQMNGAFCVWLNKRVSGRHYTAYPDDYEQISESVMDDSVALFTDSRDSMALVTDAMTTEEIEALNVQLRILHAKDAEKGWASFGAWLIKLKPFPLSVSAVLALRLGVKES